MPRRLSFLFVYGTLRPGAGTRWSKALLRASVRFEPARVKGMLYDLGQYPGMTLGGSHWVRGEVVVLREPETLTLLDAYEGGKFFERTRVRAITRRGCFDCWVYVYRRSLRGARRIECGDYLR